MKPSNESMRQSLETQVDQRQQFLVFVLRFVDVLRDFWWIVLVLWGVFSYGSNMHYTIQSLQAKYSDLENSVIEIRKGMTNIQTTVAESSGQIKSLQKDIENTGEGLREVKERTNDIQKDIKTLLSR